MKNYANFKQLKDAVSIATKTGRPTAKQLRESGEEIVAKTPAISVYKNGYFTCTVNNHSTVFGVHEIKFLDGGEDSVTKKHIQIFDIDELPWETVLYMIGTDRIERNADVREGSHRTVLCLQQKEQSVGKTQPASVRKIKMSKIVEASMAGI